MARPAAIRIALDLAFTPVLTALAARQPLPPGMITVLKIAGGCKATLDEAVATTGEPPEKVRQAVILFLETVLFTPNAGSYRILGAQRAATQAELRDHMGWLMKWLHPDREKSEWEASLSLKVSAAWDDLKSAERRQRYDEAHPFLTSSPARSNSRPRPRRTRIPWIRQPIPQELAPRSAIGRLIVLGGMALVGAGVAASVWAWPDFVESFDWRAYGSAVSESATAVGR
jgi:hypothetical protein